MTVSAFSLFALAAGCALTVPAAAASLQSAPDVLWTVQSGTDAADSLQAITTDGDGGLLLFHRSGIGLTTPWITRRGPDGVASWTRLLDLMHQETIEAAIPTADGGAIVASERRIGGSSTAHTDLIRRRYNADGQLQWAFALATQEDELFGALTSSQNDGFAIGGLSEPPLLSVAGAFIGDFNADGSTRWIRSVQGLEGAYAIDMTRLPGGGFFLVAIKPAGTGSGLSEVWLARVDESGSTIWSSLYAAEQGPFLGDMCVADNGDVIVAMTFAADTSAGPIQGPSDVLLRRFTADGSLVWERLLGTDEADREPKIEPTGAGGYVLTGTIGGDFTGSTAGIFDLFAMQLADDGATEWSVVIDSTANERRSFVARDGSGGFFIAGDTSGQLGQATFGQTDLFVQRYDSSLIGTSECGPAAVNSTGMPGATTSKGSVLAGDVALELIASDLPPGAFGHFLGSQVAAFVPNAGGSQGTLCLGGSVSRFNLAEQILQASFDGRFALEVDTTHVPTVSGPVSIFAGQTWRFQAWYRDANPMVTSNFSSAVAISFR